MAKEYLTEKFQENEEKNAWGKIFSNLRNESTIQEGKQELNTKDARLPMNARKNRYRDVLPYDQSRVRLCQSDDYINASLVEVPNAHRRYILTQGPLEYIVKDFWTMIWEQNSHAIIMLNRTVEKNANKCCQYFPVEEEGKNVFECGGAFKVSLLETDRRENFIVRQMRLENLAASCEDLRVASDGDILCNSRERTVTHFQFTTWPDFGVPTSTAAFLEFLAQVRNSGLLNWQRFGLPVVHCSAGIGRSGTFIIADSVLVMVSEMGEHSEDPSICDIYALTLHLRRFRMGLIQTADQLRFTWKAVLDALDDSKWAELLADKNFDSDFPSPPSLKRSAGNTLASGDMSLSVDNSVLTDSERSKRTRMEGEGQDTDSDSSFIASHHKQSMPSTFHPETAEGRSMYELRLRKRKEEQRRMKERLERLQSGMRDGERRSQWSLAGLGAAVAVLGFFAFCWWRSL